MNSIPELDPVKWRCDICGKGFSNDVLSSLKHRMASDKGRCLICESGRLEKELEKALEEVQSKDSNLKDLQAKFAIKLTDFELEKEQNAIATEIQKAQIERQRAIIGQLVVEKDNVLDNPIAPVAPAPVAPAPVIWVCPSCKSEKSDNNQPNNLTVLYWFCEKCNSVRLFTRKQ